MLKKRLSLRPHDHILLIEVVRMSTNMGFCDIVNGAGGDAVQKLGAAAAELLGLSVASALTVYEIEGS